MSKPTDRSVTLVTGAARGLGQALAVELAARGKRVVGLGRSLDSLRDTQSLIGDSFTPMVGDVADADAVRAAFAKIEADIGDVEVLVNNAAVYPRRDILDETAESYRHTLDVNLNGTINCTLCALERMKETGVGRIVNIASYADLSPLPASSAYSVSKGAVRIFTRTLIADLGDRFPEIVISDWLPGMLATQMGIPDGLDPAVAAKWGASLALWNDPSLNGAIFEQNLEVLPPRSLKGRIKDKLLRQSPVPRVLG